MAAPSSPAPSPSIGTWNSCSWSWGSSLTAAIRPIVPSTILIRNTGRQVRPAMLALMMKPATIGPRTAEAPSTDPNAANARGIWSREKAAVRMPMPCGMNRAPNPPCTSRAATSMPGSWASPHASDASVNPEIPIRNIRRLPYRSPRRPPTMSSTPRARA